MLITALLPAPDGPQAIAHAIQTPSARAIAERRRQTVPGGWRQMPIGRSGNVPNHAISIDNHLLSPVTEPVQRKRQDGGATAPRPANLASDHAGRLPPLAASARVISGGRRPWPARRTR